MCQQVKYTVNTAIPNKINTQEYFVLKSKLWVLLHRIWFIQLLHQLHWYRQYDWNEILGTNLLELFWWQTQLWNFSTIQWCYWYVHEVFSLLLWDDTGPCVVLVSYILKLHVLTYVQCVVHKLKTLKCSVSSGLCIGNRESSDLRDCYQRDLLSNNWNKDGFHGFNQHKCWIKLTAATATPLKVQYLEVLLLLPVSSSSTSAALFSNPWS